MILDDVRVHRSDFLPVRSKQESSLRGRKRGGVMCIGRPSSFI